MEGVEAKTLSGISVRRSMCSISIRLIWPFVELAPRVEKQGLVQQLQAQLGLTAAQFNDPDTRVSLQRALELLEDAIERGGQRYMGLHAAQRATTDHLGAIEYLARSNSTLHTALQSFVQYIRLLADGVHLHIDYRGAHAVVRVSFDGNLTLSRPVYEFAVEILLQSARRVSGNPELAPLELHFECHAPRDLTLYRAVFKCNPSFNMPATQIVLDAQTLKTPLPKAEPALHRLLARDAKRVLASLPRNEDLVTMVRDLLIAESDFGHVSATRIARRLGIGVRTLARRLGEDGTSYRGLLDETRRQVALRELAHSLRPIHQIALQLGFSSSQSFHRAFRRWTGDTAASYRERVRRSQALQ